MFKNVEKFKTLDQHGKRKEPGSQLFDTFDATDLNKELKNLMDGLSVKVRGLASAPASNPTLQEEDITS